MIDIYLYLAALLFVIGLVIVMTKRNAVIVLMGIELMLNAANINLVAFAKYDPSIKGQLFALFVIIIAASEAAVALAIVFRAVKYFKTTNLDEINKLKG